MVFVRFSYGRIIPSPSHSSFSMLAAGEHGVSIKNKRK
jgi:hypothetical protein